MGWFSKTKEKDPDKICGYLDKKGGFHRTKQSMLDRDFSDEIFNINRITEDSLKFYIRNDIATNKYMELIELLENNKLLVSVFEILQNRKEKIEKAAIKYNQK